LLLPDGAIQKGRDQKAGKLHGGDGSAWPENP